MKTHIQKCFPFFRSDFHFFHRRVVTNILGHLEEGDLWMNLDLITLKGS